MAKQERIEPGFFYTRAELCAKGEHRWESAAWTNVSTFRGDRSVMVTSELCRDCRIRRQCWRELTADDYASM